MAIDYQSLLAGDTTLQDALKAISARGAANQADLTGAGQRALIQFGQIPTDLGGSYTGADQFGYSDPLTRDLAQQATQGGISTWAQLQHAGNVNRANTIAALTARGAFHSGALGTHLNEVGLQNAQAQSQATQALLDQLHGNYQSYLTGQDQLTQNAASDVNDSYQRIIAQINAGLLGSGTPGTTATPAPKPPVTAAPHPQTQVSRNTTGYREPTYHASAPSLPAFTLPRTGQTLARSY